MTRRHEIHPSPQLLSRLQLVKLERSCAGCGVTLTYKTVKGFEYSERQGASCRRCGRAKARLVAPADLARACPSCGVAVAYKSAQAWRQAERASRRCRRCALDATRSTTRSDGWRAWRGEAYRELIEGDTPVRKAYDMLQDARAHIGGTSRPERELVEALASLGFAQGKVGRWRCDAVNHSLRAVVEVHGEWWHVRPGSRCERDVRRRYNGVHPHSRLTVEQVWARDARKQRAVERAGYAYTVVWGEDVPGWVSLLRAFASPCLNVTRDRASDQP